MRAGCQRPQLSLGVRWQPCARQVAWRPSARPGPRTGRILRSSRPAEASTVEKGQSRDLSGALSLSNIRDTLIRLEDTIIFALIERSQFARNEAVYQKPGLELPGYRWSGCSLLEYILRETEKTHGRIRRYTSPDEHAYFPEDLPPIVLPPITYEEVRRCRGCGGLGVWYSITCLMLG